MNIEIHVMHDASTDAHEIFVVRRDALTGRVSHYMSVESPETHWREVAAGSAIAPTFRTMGYDYRQLRDAIKATLQPTASVDLFEFVKAREQEMFNIIKNVAVGRLEP